MRRTEKIQRALLWPCLGAMAVMGGTAAIMHQFGIVAGAAVGLLTVGALWSLKR